MVFEVSMKNFSSEIKVFFSTSSLPLNSGVKKVIFFVISKTKVYKIGKNYFLIKSARCSYGGEMGPWYSTGALRVLLLSRHGTGPIPKVAQYRSLLKISFIRGGHFLCFAQVFINIL